jgi:hypothetical protein
MECTSPPVCFYLGYNPFYMNGFNLNFVSPFSSFGFYNLIWALVSCTNILQHSDLNPRYSLIFICSSRSLAKPRG